MKRTQMDKMIEQSPEIEAIKKRIGKRPQDHPYRKRMIAKLKATRRRIRAADSGR